MRKTHYAKSYTKGFEMTNVQQSNEKPKGLIYVTNLETKTNMIYNKERQNFITVSNSRSKLSNIVYKFKYVNSICGRS